MDHGNVILRFDKVCFAYDSKKAILEEASFSVRENAKITIMGQNGAGKSTIFKLILGAQRMSEDVTADMTLFFFYHISPLISKDFLKSY